MGNALLSIEQIQHPIPPPTGLIEALVDVASDREDHAKEAIFKSLVDIGRRKHVSVLEISLAYLTKHNKVSSVW